MLRSCSSRASACQQSAEILQQRRINPWPGPASPRLLLQPAAPATTKMQVGYSRFAEVLRSPCRIFCLLPEMDPITVNRNRCVIAGSLHAAKLFFPSLSLPTASSTLAAKTNKPRAWTRFSSASAAACGPSNDKKCRSDIPALRRSFAARAASSAPRPRWIR